MNMNMNNDYDDDDDDATNTMDPGHVDLEVFLHIIARGNASQLVVQTIPPNLVHKFGQFGPSTPNLMVPTSYAPNVGNISITPQFFLGFETTSSASCWERESGVPGVG
jgi:hypothetical protein